MIWFGRHRRPIVVCIASLLLAACSTAPQGSVSTSVVPQGRSHGGSWMAPNVSGSDLLYVSDNYTDDVYVYAYPSKTLVGTLTGFSDPIGNCVDASGNVWIVEAIARDVVEYAHGGTTPIATLAVPGVNGGPQFCAVSKKTGDLAVAIGGGSSSPPNYGVVVWQNAQGTPQQFVPPNIYNLYYCAYDAQGNLYVDGESESSPTPTYAVLPNGASAFNGLTLNTSPGYPGGLQFVKGQLNAGGVAVVGSSSEGAIYQYSISGNTGTQVGSTLLTGSVSTPAGFVIRDKRAVWFNNGAVGHATLGIYPYPGGGSPIKTITQPGETTGVTISVAPAAAPRR